MVERPKAPHRPKLSLPRVHRPRRDGWRDAVTLSRKISVIKFKVRLITFNVLLLLSLSRVLIDALALARATDEDGPIRHGDAMRAAGVLLALGKGVEERSDARVEDGHPMVPCVADVQVVGMHCDAGRPIEIVDLVAAAADGQQVAALRRSGGGGLVKCEAVDLVRVRV